MSIGGILFEARRESGLTVTEVSEQTHIRETIIMAIEGDDFSACGGDSYVRGYIRSVARAVGTDPEPLIWQYMTARLEPATVEDARRPTSSTWASGSARPEPTVVGDSAAPPSAWEQRPALPEAEAFDDGGARPPLPIWEERAVSREPARRAPAAAPEPSIWDEPSLSPEPAAPEDLAEPERPARHRIISPEPAPAEKAAEPEPAVWAREAAPPEAGKADAPPPEPSIWDQDLAGQGPVRLGVPAPEPSIWDQDVAGQAPGPVRQDVPAPEPPFWEQRQGGTERRDADDDDADPVRPSRTRKRLRLSWIGGLVLIWLGLAIYDLHAGLPLTAGASPSAPARPVTRQHTGSQPPSPRKRTTPGGAKVHALTPASAAAFQPFGAKHGDHANLAYLAIDGRLTTAWDTDWYKTAHLGNLYPGTGLLVDMGHPVTIDAARVRLAHAPGAAFELRVGNAPVMSGLRTVAQVTDAEGVVHVPLARPARGRYVLIWFTTLPPTSKGRFQARVYNVWLGG